MSFGDCESVLSFGDDMPAISDNLQEYLERETCRIATQAWKSM